MPNSSSLADIPDDWTLYPYTPVKPLPFIFAVIIGILGCILFWQNFIRYKWKRFGFTMLWAVLVWTVGFVCRAYSQYHTQNIGMYIAQYVLILMGAPLFAASESFLLGRLLAYLPYHAVIHPGRVVSTFVILSALIEALAGNGASRLANVNLPPSARHTGFVLIETSLLLQVALELSFLGLTTYLAIQCRRSGTMTKGIRTMLVVLILTSTMMLVRCVVRVSEAFEAESCGAATALEVGGCGYAVSHEWILWVWEVANITLFVVALTIFTPGAYLPHSDKVYLDRTDLVERLGPGFTELDKRPLLYTVLDPFNLAGILGGKGYSVSAFWEERNPEYVGQEIPPSKEAILWAKVFSCGTRRAKGYTGGDMRKESV